MTRSAYIYEINYYCEVREQRIVGTESVQVTS